MEEEFTKLYREFEKKLSKIKMDMFTQEECILQEEEVANREEYEGVVRKYSRYSKWDEIINSFALDFDEKRFFHKAYCSVCGKDEFFYYQGYEPLELYGFEGKGVHMFREEFFCPKCGGNARLRFMIHKIRQEYKRGMKVYLYERITPTYQAIEKFIPDEDLMGSEYFGDAYRSGEYVGDILHEDAADLSFPDNSFDLMLSMDVFEHTYYYKKVFLEVYRVLKPGGKMFLTIPLRPAENGTIERAKIVDGKIVHLLKPCMHGDPMNPDGGVLEFIQYGWDILSFIKGIGFEQVKMKTYYSINDAYLGVVPFYFEIVK